VREPLRAAGAGHDAEVDLRLSELRRLRRDDQVARHRQLAAAAEAIAGDGRDERRAQRADRVPLVDASVLVELDRRRVGELGNVRACCERALVAADDDAADRAVVVEAAQGRHQLVHQRPGERVELLRPVEKDHGDRSIPLDEDERRVSVRHFFRSRNARTAPCASSPSIDIASQSRAWPIVWLHARSRQTFSCVFA